MNKYSTHTQFLDIWISKIPAHWQAHKMKHLFSERSEKGYPNEPLLVASQNMGVVPKNVYGNRTVEAQKDLHLLKLVRVGDFVISLRSFQGGLEYAYYQGIISPAYTILIPHEPMSGSYFRYLAKSKPFIGLLTLCVTGIREGQNIDYAKLKNHLLPVPPREEQDQIVRFLDWKVSNINKLINIKKKEIKAIDALKRSMVSHAITRGLTTDAPMKYSGVKWLGDIPQRWYTVPLYAIAQVKSINNCIDLPLMSVYLDAGVVPFVEREEKRTNATSKDLTNYQRVDPGDFVLNNQQAWRGSVGVSFHSGIVSPAYIVLSLDNTLDSHYANYLFRSRCMVDQYLVISREVGSIQRNLYWSALKRVVVPIPSKKEQMEIVEYLDGLNNKFDDTIKKLTEEVAVLEEYKNKIIADTVTGKIDVRGIEIPEYEFVDEDNDNVDENLEQGADEPPEEE